MREDVMSKFNVGDRVRLTAKWAESDPSDTGKTQVGWLGTVTNPDDGHSLWPVRVRMDKQTESFDWDMAEEELELVAEG
jgi:hypothetical protein